MDNVVTLQTAASAAVRRDARTSYKSYFVAAPLEIFGRVIDRRFIRINASEA